MTKSMPISEWKSCCRRSPSPPRSRGARARTTLMPLRPTSTVFLRISWQMHKSIELTCCLAPTTRRSIKLFTLMDLGPLARQLMNSRQPSLSFWRQKVLIVSLAKQLHLRPLCRKRRMTMTTSWITNGQSSHRAWNRAGPRLLMMANSSMSLGQTRTTYSRKALCP